MLISEKIELQPWYARLGRRGPNFKIMVAHLERASIDSKGAWCPFVVETGTAHDKDNFEGQGQSTLIWDWLSNEIPNIRAISIDIREIAVKTAQAQTQHVRYICGDSIKTLNELKVRGTISLMYFDSYDWTEEGNLSCGIHHFFEFASVWAGLEPGTMVVVDDRHGEMKGKHWVISEYMKIIGQTPVFKNNQIGWIK